MLGWKPYESEYDVEEWMSKKKMILVMIVLMNSVFAHFNLLAC